MAENYITLEEAAVFEGVKYNTLLQRILRNPESYQTCKEARESEGGRERVLVAVSSLSTKGKRKYRESQKVSVSLYSEELETPWYLDVDLNWYIENNRQRYYEAVELAKKIKAFVNYNDRERTAYAKEVASKLGISQRTLYRYTENYLEAEAWSLKLEREEGKRFDFFMPLSLCRKPKAMFTFPSLTAEQKAFIENVWFDKEFAANDGTIEMVYILFERQAEEKQWDNYPSIKTVARYIKYLMDELRGKNARFLQANGIREFRNKKMVKARRDTQSLGVMEFVQGDEHTFDIWVQYTMPNGKVKAVRPKLVCWIDIRTRCILGDIMCVDANTQIVKESFVKMVYSYPGGVPKHVLIDNGKDYTALEMTGQSRKIRKFDQKIDRELRGFYQSIGVEEWSRALPYQGWTKAQVERFFGTVCQGFSKWFSSYVGTLTGSLTSAKKKKPIKQMLEKGELFTMEEFFDLWTKWKDEFYHQKEHGGLRAFHEKYVKPIELFQKADNRYFKAVPPREYAAILMMRGDTARVYNQGITKFNTLYTGDGLEHYIGETVSVKWDIDNVTKLYVYTLSGKKICEATSAELLQFAPGISQAKLEKHMQRQKRQIRGEREKIEEYTTPFELRGNNPNATSRTVGSVSFNLKPERDEKVVSLPQDKEYHEEIKTTKKQKGKKDKTDGSYLDKKADEVLSKLREIG